jgi:electron transfer flavoprotein beta subunit
MVNIATLVKLSLNLNLLKIESDGRVNTADTQLAISEYDKNAIEEAIRIKEKHGGKIVCVSALTWGPVNKKISDAERILREVLALGVDEAHFIIDDVLDNCTPLETSLALASLIRKLGNFDLFIAGESSMDISNSQIPARIASILDIPFVTYVRKVEISGNNLILQREMPNGIETVEVPMPAVISVTGEINQPRLPTLRQILQSKNKPLMKYTLKDLGINLNAKLMKQRIEIRPVVRKNIIYEGGNLEEIAQKLVDNLIQEGVIKA